MMAGLPGGDQSEQSRIILGLLESVERDGSKSQRGLAADLGIALGLVNAYVKRCVRKGLLKVSTAPRRRYAYYLTPKGFAEKSRLTFEFLSESLSLFRRARADCRQVFQKARARGYRRIMLAGASDIAEVAMICAVESGVEIVAVVDPKFREPQFVGLPTYSSFDDVADDAFDCIVVTDLRFPGQTFEAVAKRYGTERVYAPALFGLGRKNRKERAS